MSKDPVSLLYEVRDAEAANILINVETNNPFLTTVHANNPVAILAKLKQEFYKGR